MDNKADNALDCLPIRIGFLPSMTQNGNVQLLYHSEKKIDSRAVDLSMIKIN